MRPSLLPKAIDTLYDLRQPTMFWGSPGICKTTVLTDYCKNKKITLIKKKSKDAFESKNHPSLFRLIDRRAILMDPTETGGFPAADLQKRLAYYLQFDWLPRDGYGIIFFDELPLAPTMVMNALLQLIHDRRLHDYILPEGWVCFGAGNRVQDKAGSNRMTSPLRNRFVHIDVEVNHADWVKYALEHNFAWEVVYYIRWRPEALFQFDPTKDENAFATPRTWEFTSNIMKAQPDPSIRYELILGTVGRAQATEFEGFCKIAHALPDPKAVIRDPEKVTIPTDPAAQVALCGALIQMVKQSESLIGPVTRFAARLKKEFAVFLVKDCETQNPKVTEEDGYVKWIGQNPWYSGLAKQT